MELLIRPVEVDEQFTTKPVWRAASKYVWIFTMTALAAVLALAVDQIVTWIVYWGIASLVHLGLLASGHELVHNHLFKKRLTNQTVAYAIGLVTLFPMTGYRFYHLQHHAKLGTELDPEGILDLRLNRFELAIALLFSGPVVILGMWLEPIRAITGRRLHWGKGGKARRDLVLDVVMLLGSVAVLAGVVSIVGWRSAAFVYFIPVVISMTFWSGYIAIPEHYGLRVGSTPDDITRNIHSNRLMSFLYWNANLHATHHWAPQVPYQHLKALTDTLDWPHAPKSYASVWRDFWAEPTQPDGIDPDSVDIDLTSDLSADVLSGRGDSNSRSPAPKAGALAELGHFPDD